MIVLARLLSSTLQSCTNFWYARTGIPGLRVAGYIRILYAILYLADRSLLGMDVQLLFDPYNGMIPYRFAKNQFDYIDATYSIWSLAPNSRCLLWFMYLSGLFHGVCLLFGIGYPRLHAMAIFFDLVQFHRHNAVTWDGEDYMSQMWSFFLIFLPLHHITIYDQFGRTTSTAHSTLLSSSTSKDERIENDVHKDKQDVKYIDSWPMWPFRLWQIYTCFVYMGAAFGKLDGEAWMNGDAIYWVSYCDDFWGMIFNPDWLFNRLWSMKLMTWTALLIETICFITIWPRSTRRITMILLVLLHVGIDLTMNMHIFEWLSLLGWVVFLVEPLEQSSWSSSLVAVVVDSQGSTKQSTMVISHDPTMEVSQTAAKTTIDDKLIPKDTSKKGTLPIHGGRRSSIYWYLQRFVESCIILCLVPWFIIDTFPGPQVLGTIEQHIPMSMPTLRMNLYTTTKSYVVDPMNQIHTILFPYYSTIGLYMGVWDLYAGMPDNANSRYIGIIHYHNGTIGQWTSPNWKEMSWYVRKRHLRLMNYYEYLEGKTSFPAHVALCHYLGQQYATNPHSIGSSIEWVQLLRRTEWAVVDPSEIPSWFIPARQPMDHTIVDVYTLHWNHEGGNGIRGIEQNSTSTASTTNDDDDESFDFWTKYGDYNNDPDDDDD